MGTFNFLRLLLKKDSSSKKSKSSVKSDGNTTSPTTTSATSTGSATHEYGEQGRRYHDRADASYILPNDEEESDRIHMQHWIVKLAFSGNFDSPVGSMLEQGINVLDAGCGPATWPLEMAEMFPQSKFYGVDISPVFPMQIKPSNCEFLLHNLSDPLPYPNNYFGFVHQRLLVMGIVDDDWIKIAKDYVRVTQPGGWIELTECTMPDIVNGGPNMTTLMTAVGAIAKSKGLNTRVSLELASILKQAGCVNITERKVVSPIKHGGKLGELLWDDFYTMFSALRPMVVKSRPDLETPEAYDKFLRESAAECSTYKTGLIWYRSYGQKPGF
ncbi:S-adenosyl-L-methionine-dependent methyltransferase [Fennellomyces sp. T-0311]|nr:S-adenosyl-L-methionine-dependent methyltransferase [Fennellomyces sp. T-0311]